MGAWPSVDVVTCVSDYVITGSVCDENCWMLVQVVVWDTLTGDIVSRFPSNHVGAPRWLEHSPTESSFVTCGSDRSIRFWREAVKSSGNEHHSSSFWSGLCSAVGSNCEKNSESAFNRDWHQWEEAVLKGIWGYCLHVKLAIRAPWVVEMQFHLFLFWTD
jgi:WD40 repeat protein